jgi:biopolymer transport protein ExbB
MRASGRGRYRAAGFSIGVAVTDLFQETLAALLVGGVMIYPLALLALLATVIVLDKAVVYVGRTRLPKALIGTVETYGFAWPDLERGLANMRPKNYARRFLEVIAAHRAHPAWWVESRATDEATLIEQSLGRWLWVLETIVTAAPLLGLLGTIVGMIRAFNLFGRQGLVDPAGVTGGVAEALIATAVGLFVALLALFAFNFFSRRQAQFMDELERLGTRLVDHIRLDQENGRQEGVAP